VTKKQNHEKKLNRMLDDIIELQIKDPKNTPDKVIITSTNYNTALSCMSNKKGKAKISKRH
jgi:hypothetical protein